MVRKIFCTATLGEILRLGGHLDGGILEVSHMPRARNPTEVQSTLIASIYHYWVTKIVVVFLKARAGKDNPAYFIDLIRVIEKCMQARGILHSLSRLNVLLPKL